MVRVVPIPPVVKTPVTVSGVVTLGPGASCAVLNSTVTANTVFSLTMQDGGTIPKGSPYILTRIVGTNFTIKSTVNTDTGVRVYWQMIEPN